MNISPSIYEYLSLDLPPILTSIFAALSCTLLGNFLLLRRMSLLGDAISHSVLPGIVLAFLISGSRANMPVFLGATIAGIITGVLVEAVTKLGKVESGASLGVIFSILFASGVLLMEQAAARSVDLDADCLLHGQLESIIWYPPHSTSEFFSRNTLQLLPVELTSSFVVFALTLLFILIFFKELKLTTFDSALAFALNFKPQLMHYLLIIFTAAAVVSSFKAVGSIIVISTIICPAATARLMTDKLNLQIILSALFSIAATVIGYILGAFGPHWFGYANSISSSGMIAVTSGGFLTLSVFFAPHYGIVSKKIRQQKVKINIALEDLLGSLYRAEEEGSNFPLPFKYADGVRYFSKKLFPSIIKLALKRQLILLKEDCITLTTYGREFGKSLVRTHRLWETYLVTRAGLKPDHVHQRAEQLEHFTTEPHIERLAKTDPQTDPHGREIPALKPQKEIDK